GLTMYQLNIGAPSLASHLFSALLFLCGTTMHYQYDDINPDDYIKSKSQVKREMTALQKLGERLVEMNDKQLATIPLEENLLKAVLEARKMPQREARRRQLQFIGKLMRSADNLAIQEAVDQLQDK